MGNPLQLLLISIVIYVVGAILPPLVSRSERQVIRLSGIASMVGGIFGLLASAPVLMGAEVMTFATDGPFSFAHFIVRLDGLAAFMVMVISLLVVVTALYSLSYVEEYIGKGARYMGLFMNLFIASMVALVVMDNAFYFLVFFEMMSLASYFLVITEQDDEAVSAGLLYFLIAHAGSVLIMIAFFILYKESGSMDFDSFRQASLSAPEASVVFLLAFFGFGAKAGMIPLHGWLPRAHPAAPSHASALMSGVMVKIGIFGIIKVGIDILGATSAWWGLVVLAFGAVSAVLGVMYALAEHDIKKLLAYHTVENIGIILMGVGVGMIGIATQHPVLAVVGILGGLYHLLNHAVFKGLLFLGAGSVMYRVHTKDMELMGGLAKLMPYTAITFLIGTMAISALPPLNGFVSEWFTYQALFTMSHEGSFIMRIAGPVAIVMLAITGALAALCFVKVYGISFAGAARSEKAANATEVPLPMILAMVLLALLCIALGVGAPLVSPVIADISAQLTGQATMSVASGSLVFPGSSPQTVLSTPLIALLLIGFLTLPLLIYSIFKSQRLRHRHGGNPWACGYGYDGQMAVSAGGFTQPLRTMFAPLYRLRKTLDPSPALSQAMQSTIRGATRAEPWWEEKVVLPIARAVLWSGKRIQWLQHGDFRLYCLYVVIALTVLMLVTVM
ncbi:hydrogenase 4 subunit B [Limnobaculum xujianqingii]|uniref:hydrogenase 4 subunit B n=1 Tax=Limnobaculum xujianqingii TaxID=2738837 RepID=UPI00112CFC0A|nr:hydrogenase 4 subunit B [Limnobaculum xujianqingii]